MKIVYLHQYFRTPTMAGGTRSYEFARRMVERGHQVHVITSDTGLSDAGPTGNRPGPTWRTSVEGGAVVHWARVPYDNSMRYRDRLRAFGRFAWLAARRASVLDQDVVLATSTPLSIALPAVYSARRKRVPMVLEIRDLWPEIPIALGALRSPLTRRAAWLLESWAYRNARHVIALSPGMADSISTRHPDRPVTVVPNGCDRELFADAERAGRTFRASTPWLGDRPLILYAGTLGLVNDLGYLVRMAAAMSGRHPEIRFVVVGRGGQQEHVRRLAAELGVLDRNLFMLDQVPKSEVVGLFGAADLAISTVIDDPTLHANSANKVFDAWAAGCPVALNQEGWLADRVRASGAGVILPPGDPTTGAALAASFLAEPARTAAARAAALRLAREEFDRDLLFQRLEDVLCQVVGADQSSLVGASGGLPA
ncbi:MULTISPECIES: glycosyltransferase family 4 protein [Micromonospora]|uniref:Glycosyl transferase n=1 Tax=Micromonospora maris TaxID=1003110 RepID=A0A9X0I8V3_9ACTN|nr:glycosyltransferase family 4 protein [Micromonospora maris]AEB43904.1 glycosyl transferase group 1 protein [Micromonospora maris AB-18-032]KUJ49154.1 glycosyl transferase [Micromonospora maris]